MIFHTITNDNGSEFADQDGIDALGVTTFYCHPQSPHERGTNEVTNKLVRRKLPKGKSMAKVTQKQATEVQHWVNHYTRPMFGGKSAADMLKEELDKLPYTTAKRYTASLTCSSSGPQYAPPARRNATGLKGVAKKQKIPVQIALANSATGIFHHKSNKLSIDTFV